MKRLKEVIMKDLGWKILSLVIAVSLWFMVINMEHPVDTRVYVQTIEMKNMNVLLAEGLTVSNLMELEAEKVSFKAKAQRTALDRLSRYKDKISAFVDLKDAANAQDGDTLSLEVQILLPEEAGVGFEILNRDPFMVEVKIEKKISKEFPVTLSLEGGAEKNLVLGDVTVLPETVTVSGAKSAVEQVVTVEGLLPVDTTTDIIDRKVTLRPCDKEGTLVKSVSLSEKEAHVVAGMYEGKEISLKVDLRGMVAEGYGIGEVTMTPQKVTVYGDKAILKGLTICQLPEVSVEGATKDVVQSFAIQDWLPEGVALVEDATAKVRVHILEQSKVTMYLPVDKIAINGADTAQWQYHFVDEEVQVQCTGPAEVMKTLTGGEITGSIDVAGLGQGQKKVEVKVNLPQKVTVVGTAPKVTMEIKKLADMDENTVVETE